MIVTGSFQGRTVSIRLVDGDVKAPTDVLRAYTAAVASGFAYVNPIVATDTPGEGSDWDFCVTAASVLEPGTASWPAVDRPEPLPDDVDI